MKAASEYPLPRHGVPAAQGPRRPGQPGPPPEIPAPPRWPDMPRPETRPGEPVIAPGRAWTDSADWQTRMNERLLEKRVIMAHGHLDDTAATTLCAQLLTLDADSPDRSAPIRLHLQNLTADLPAALTVMDALDAVGVPVHSYAAGQISGSALGVLVSAGRRAASPNAGFVLVEPQTAAEGTAAELAARTRQVEGMLDALYFRLADVTGREVDEIRGDARRGRFLSATEAVGYGLVHEVTRQPNS
jgi:ATP-dependent Clp protease, protease subunit